jgi:hypothetical protein
MSQLPLIGTFTQGGISPLPSQARDSLGAEMRMRKTRHHRCIHIPPSSSRDINLKRRPDTQKTPGALTAVSHFHGAFRTQVSPQHILQPSGSTHVDSQSRLGSRHLSLGVHSFDRSHRLTVESKNSLCRGSEAPRPNLLSFSQSSP